MYSKSFFITHPVSNNFFSFEKRQKPQLFVAPLIDGRIEDVRIGEKIVFEDFDENEILRSCKGLAHFIRIIHKAKVPLYIFDNHNHAFAFWHSEMISGNLASGSTLVHIDAHKDTRIPEKFLSPQEACDEQKVFEYTNTVLNVGNFIPAAERTGLVKNIFFVTSESELKDFDVPKFLQEKEPFILDVDVDFFAPELDYIDNDKKVELIQKLLPHASVVTFATSPFFIEQEKAISWLQRILH